MTMCVWISLQWDSFTLCDWCGKIIAENVNGKGCLRITLKYFWIHWMKGWDDLILPQIKYKTVWNQ